MICKTFNLGELKHYKYVVVLSRYEGKILLSKHKGRPTWETQGGHIEDGETPFEAAKRELYEESGAIRYELWPLFDYIVFDGEAKNHAGGMVFAAEIFKLGDMPDSEMEQVKAFEQLPKNLTYPDITPVLFHQFKDINQPEGRVRELVIDLQDYTKDKSVFRRTAARGIIKKNGRYLLIHSKYGDHKFPGGGMEKGERIEETLIREVREETGYTVLEHSIAKAFVVTEKRKGNKEDLLMMESHYFYCEVNDSAGSRELDDYEADYDYQTDWMTLDEAIIKNERVKDHKLIPWIVRDTLVMKRLNQ